MRLILALTFAFFSVGAANAQQTCSKLAAECVAFNKKGGWPTDRCEGYKQQCMATGKWVDKNRTFNNVTKK